MGPVAKPEVSTMPAMVTPPAPRSLPAQAVPALTARPTPRPTMKRPTIRPAAPCHNSRLRLPSAATTPPVSTTGRAPMRSATMPPNSRHGTSPSA